MSRRFCYARSIEKLNSFVWPEDTTLPNVKGKTNIMQEINQGFQNCMPPILYRYMSLENLSLADMEDVIKGNVYMANASRMNDVFEGAVFGTLSSDKMNFNETQRIQNEICLKSFTYAKDSNLMWSHYGNAHKGICVGYNFSKAPSDVCSHLFPVQYSNARFFHENIQNVQSHPFVYLRKSLCWKYEKEFRLIYKRDELYVNEPIEIDCVEDLIFGMRVCPQKRSEVIELVKSKKPNIRLYQTKQKENSFKLRREEIKLF